VGEDGDDEFLKLNDFDHDLGFPPGLRRISIPVWPLKY